MVMAKRGVLPRDETPRDAGGARTKPHRNERAPATDDWVPDWEEAFPSLTPATADGAVDGTTSSRVAPREEDAGRSLDAAREEDGAPDATRGSAAAPATRASVARRAAPSAVRWTSPKIVLRADAIGAPSSGSDEASSRGGNGRGGPPQSSPVGVDELLDQYDTSWFPASFFSAPDGGDGKQSHAASQSRLPVAPRELFGDPEDARDVLAQCDEACTKGDVSALFKLASCDAVMDVLDYVITGRGCFDDSTLCDACSDAGSAVGSSIFSGDFDDELEEFDEASACDAAKVGAAGDGKARLSRVLLSKVKRAGGKNKKAKEAQVEALFKKEDLEPSADPSYRGRAKLL